MPTRKEVTKSLLNAAKYWADQAESGAYNDMGAERCAHAAKQFIEAAKELQQLENSCFDPESD